MTQPDIDWLQAGVTLVETYHRMPTACPACPFPSVGVAIPAANLKLFGTSKASKK